MTKITLLDLTQNQLKGPIPSSLSTLKNLEIVLLSDNNISGIVEADIFLSLKKLKALYLGGNKITLSFIDYHTSDTLPKFEILWLESCNLKVFPDFLRFQDQLQELSLDDNKIDGPIPEWMGNTSKETLQALSLSQNSIRGFEQHSSVLPWVGLRELDLSHNMLQGSIPMPPPTTMNFLVLDLSFNNITGSITPCIERIEESLLVLNLRSNVLRGTIPNTFTNGSKLHMISLSENQLEDQLPRSLENCASLQILDLGNNHIEDMFPFWLEKLSELQVLILKSNKFHGAIPIPEKTNSKFPKLRIIDLSYNSFSGDLPHRYFQGWSAMKDTKSDATYMQARIDIWVENYGGLGIIHTQ
ncbi:receptor-like protein 6 [Cynara cardunculus var. scolymus]|uniref:Leucine-rich repeat-containing protein n=1 Tax=Cynara cardunculus var. scolymus TaxID=59895 RepID=A0A118K6F0_CYNCS|nr:receptor-like protein 6 [Cynara cardunculus var. scolymus]KVI10573.1 Leucine-rich repeat-containing protein [Cynara cardunculus var. scolymus]